MSTPLPLNDETDYGLCFACGPRSPSGLRLRFERDGDRIVTSYTPRAEHQGFPGYLHGGVITALLDEAMSRISLIEGRWTMTARLDVRYRKPMYVGQTVRAFAEKKSERRGVIEAVGWVELPDGSKAAEATGTFVPVRDDTLESMTEGYPQLAQTWMRGSA